MKRRDLKIIWSSNSSFSFSGYGSFTRDIIKRMIEDDWPVAEIGWFGLQGHPIEYQNHKIYPAMRHTFGSDAIVHHSKDFGANVIFTMQDIWALDQNDLRQLKTWIPYCLDGKIKVSFVDGREIPIKEVVENKIEDKVWGYKDGKVVPSKIKAWQDIPEKMDVYEIKTKSSKILITGNNEVWVTSIINKPILLLLTLVSLLLFCPLLLQYTISQ